MLTATCPVATTLPDTAPHACACAKCTSAAEIFRALRGENFLRDLGREAFVARLAYYLGEINAVHPFREGNGRTQRAFFEQLARDAGHTIAWQHLDATWNIEASAAIMRGDAEPMRKMLDQLTER